MYLSLKMEKVTCSKKIITTLKWFSTHAKFQGFFLCYKILLASSQKKWGRHWVASCAKDFLKKNPKLPYFEKKKVEFATFRP
jgi:hypothetical protein